MLFSRYLLGIFLGIGEGPAALDIFLDDLIHDDLGEMLEYQVGRRDDLFPALVLCCCFYLGDIDSLFDMKGAVSGAPQLVQMSPASQMLAHIVGDGADVSSLAAFDLDGQQWVIPLDDIETGDVDSPGLSFYFNTGSGQLIERLSSLLDSAVHRRDLFDITPKLVQDGLSLFQRKLRDIAFGRNLPSGVIGVGGNAEAYLGLIYLGRVRQECGQSSGTANEDRQDACGHRIKGSGMSHFSLAGESAYKGDHLEGGFTLGFVEI